MSEPDNILRPDFGSAPIALNSTGRLELGGACPSSQSPTGLHFFHCEDYLGAKSKCRFCGMPEADVLAEAESPDVEENEHRVSREQCESVARQLTKFPCRTAKRKVGKRKICILHVDRGEQLRGLMFEATDWWLVLRALYSFLKNTNGLPPPEDDQGGMLIPA